MIPLHTLVAAIRAHQPTRDVVPVWLVKATVHEWVDTRGEMDRYIADDAARLIVEACMWNYCAKNHIQVVWSGDQWCKPVMRSLKSLGDDLIAALMFACGVPVEVPK